MHSISPSVNSRHRRHRLALLLVQRVVVNRPVRHLRLPLLLVEVRQRVLHPVVVQPVRVVLVRVRAPALLPLLRRVHGGGGAAQEVAKLERLDEVGVPHQGLVGDLDVVDLSDHLVDLLLSLRQEFRRAVDGRLVLHDLLHLGSDLGGGRAALGVSNLVQVGHAVHPHVRRSVRDGIAGLCDLRDAIRAGAPEHNDVQERVGSEAIGPMDAG
mmetsp:Transcript_45065/g.95877  ORF Transcript_45065/g.95877 Transcript_45065/m.95877 type:complete len:212 (+) Transcript_45065:132-767(+)